MTSFQRFKRDVRSKSSSQIKSSAFRGSERKDSLIHNLLSFSASQIRFVCNEKVPYSIFKLKITNLTGYSIHFKIRCNNSQCYSVTPYEQVIKDKESMQVKFEFMAKSIDLSNNFSDKFQILWGKIPYKPNEPATLTQSKVFNVFIDIKDNNADFFQGFNQFKTQQQVRYDGNKVGSPNNINYGNTMGEKVEYQYQTATQPTLLTKTNLILVCLISFVLGFIFT